MTETTPIAPRPSRFFEDLVIGERRKSSPRRIDEAEILDFARRYDPQWFHNDAEAAKASIFGGLVASGIHTAALWRQMDHEINGDIAFACGIGWDETRWKRGLRPGDIIHAESEILDKRASQSSGDRGVSRFACSVRLESGAVVLSFISINLVYTRQSDAAQALARG
jgi:acyl dehydratase